MNPWTLAEDQFVPGQGEVLPQDRVVAAVRFVGTHPFGRPLHKGVGPDAAGGSVLHVAVVKRKAGAPGARHAALVLVGFNEAQVLVPGEQGLSVREVPQVVAGELVKDEILEVVAEFPEEMLRDLASEVELAIRHHAAQFVVGRGEVRIVEGLVAVETKEIKGLLVGELGSEREADARDQEPVVVAEHIELRTFREPGSFHIKLLTRIGIPVSLAEIIDIGEGTQLEAFVLVEGNDRKTAEREARLSDFLGIVVLSRRRKGERQKDKQCCDMFHLSNSFQIFGQVVFHVPDPVVEQVPPG